MIACVLASGALLCVLPLGLVLARGLRYERRADAWALATPLGVATVSIPLVLCAVLGIFRPAWIGAAGWCVAIGAFAWLVTRGNRPFPSQRDRRIRQLAVAAIVGCAAVLYLGFPAESPLGGRDEGLHSLAGLSLERTGTLALSRPEAIALAPALFAPFFQGLEFHLPGIPAASVLKPQFSPLLPSWIAQLHAAGGDRWLYRINALFTLAAIGVFYRLARRFVRPPFAVLALAVFALNPAQVWIARINLSEPLGELLALGAILLAVDALRSRSDARILASAALFGVACSVRLDLAIVAPLLFAAAFAASLWGPPFDADAGRLFRLAAATLAAQAVAVIALGAWSPAYAMDHAFAPALALAASAALALGYGIASRHSFGWARHPATRRRFAVVCVLLLCAGFAYAAFVRPHVGSFAVIPGQSAVAGLRDYREESLRNLAAYLAWPTLLFALAGMSVAIVRLLTKRTDAAMALLVTLAAGINGVLLVAPLVSPDHFWAIRRFATLAIPLGVLIAAWGVQCAARATAGWRYARATAALVIATIAGMLWVQRATLFVRENAGLTAQLRALDAALPGGSLIVRDFDALATTLALGFGRAVLPLRDAHVAVDAAAQSFWRSCATTRCTLVHASFDGLGGLHAGPTQVASLTRRYITPTYTPLPTETTTETTNLLVTPILGLASGAPPRNAGAARDWRLPDRGFYREEPAATPARWTDGDALLVLPQWRADALELRLAAAAGAPARDVRIDLSGRRVFEGRLAPGEHTLTFALESGSVEQQRLAIRGATFVPRTLGLNSDRRTLNVLVRAVRLIDATVTPMTPTASATAYRSAIDVPGGRERLPRRMNLAHALRITVEVENRGTMTWPSLGEVEGGAPHVALGIVWSRAGERERLLEQRQQLPYSLRPCERVRIDVPIDPRALARVPDGTVEVGIGLVHEGVAWFADRGDAMISFPLDIVR